MQRFLIVAIVAAALAALIPAVALAVIAGTGGAVVPVGPPASVVVSTTESDVDILAFNELHKVTLPGPVEVDITAPGTYTTFTSDADLSVGTIPPGLVINSHFLHFDPITPGTSLVGSISFDNTIIGLIITSPRLDDSDPLGDPGVAYPPAGSDPGRGLESPPLPGADEIIDFPLDRKSVEVDLTATTGLDHVRIVTVFPAKDLKIESIALLTPYDNNKKIAKAIRELNKSLKASLWLDPSHLASKEGKAVFRSERKAVKDLLGVIKKGKASPAALAAAGEAIEKMVSADANLAWLAIQDAGSPTDGKAQKELERAHKEMGKAADELAKGNPDKAISHYEKVWNHAQKAMK